MYSLAHLGSVYAAHGSSVCACQILAHVPTTTLIFHCGVGTSNTGITTYQWSDIHTPQDLQPEDSSQSL